VWNPHLFYVPHYREGRATMSFRLRLEKGAICVHEWRDEAQPYRVGPSLRFGADGALVANGKPLGTVPLGTWVTVAIECGLGSQADGRYRLTLTVPGEKPVERRLACGSARFRRLAWLGFVSLAAEKTTFYLDSLRLNLVDR